MKIKMICLLLPVVLWAQIPSHEYIINLSKKNNDKRSWLVIPVTLHNKKGHALIGNTRLYSYYLKHIESQRLDYSDFLEDILRDKLSVNPERLNLKDNDIEDDTTILKLYEKKGIKFIEQKFFELTSGHLLIKSSADKEHRKSLAFIMFSNDYYISQSDYNGYLYFYK